MAAELGKGDDAPWEWGENGAIALAWRRAENCNNLFKGFSTQEYLGEFSRKDFAGWTAFQAEVSAAGETANGLKVVKHWMGTLAAYSEQMRTSTEKWYRDSVRARNDRAARDFKFQGERAREEGSSR